MLGGFDDYVLEAFRRVVNIDEIIPNEFYILFSALVVFFKSQLAESFAVISIIITFGPLLKMIRSAIL